MIDTIRSLTLPYTQSLMGHRNLIIVLFGLGLSGLIILYLVAHWRVQRLQLDLAEERANAPQSGRKTYAPVSTAPEEVIDRSSTLPPVRGGRTYARNLGTALQKAGIPGPLTGPGGQPIYTPPAPGGWNPNPGTAQPPPAQGQPPTYSPPLPWGTPMPPAGIPGGWPYGPPLGPVSPPLPQTPTVGPSYYPPALPAAPPGAPAGPAGPPLYAPAPYGLPQPPAPQGIPTVQVGMADTSAVEPSPTGSFAGGAPPMVTPEAPDEESVPKPKRRRFGLHVLQTLEKALQEKAASLIEAAPLGPVTKAPAPPAPPAAPAASAITPAPAAQSAPAPPPAPVAPAGPVISPAPVPFASPTPPAPIAPPIVTPPAPAAGEAFPFESFAAKRVPPAPPSAPAPVRDIRETPPVEVARPAEEDQRPEQATASTARDEEQNVTSEPPESQVESSRELSRSAMRAMLFGDEPSQARQVNTEPATTLPGEEGAEPAVFHPAAETEPVANMEALSEEPTSLVETATPQAGETVSSDTAEIEGEAPQDLESTVEAAPEPPAVPVAPESVAEIAWVIDQETSVTSEPMEPLPAPEPAHSGKGTIVIIEDDEQVGQYYATLLGGNGYAVEVATNGSSGVDLCTRLRPQLILLDVMMPRQNGILVLQTLRATDETRETPVVVLSNFSEPTLIRRALQLGALEYVIKTQVDGAALLEAIPRWMDHEKAFAS